MFAINVRKKVVFLLYLLFPCAGIHTAQVVCVGKQVLLIEDSYCNPNPLIERFSDDFEGNTLDTSKWFPSIGVMRDIEYKDTKQWFTAENISVSEGTLKLTVKSEMLTNHCYDIWIGNTTKTLCSDFSFSAAEIRSHQKFSHGKFELSCKLPKGKGLAMAFWMYGYQNQNEIDVFEIHNENNIFGKHDPEKLSRVQHMNSRTDYENDGIIEDCSSRYNGPDFSETFHTFSVIWTPHKIEWYIDGELKRTSTLFYSISGQEIDCNSLKAGTELILNRAFPRNPMEIFISFGVQTGKNQPDQSTFLPAVFEIDYIRYYQQ